MARLSWYKRYPQDALDGMRLLTLEERGAYNTVLDLIYLRGGDLPDDDRFIAGHLNCDVRVWRRIKARLIALGKLQLVDGTIHNRRADVEVDSALAITVRISDVRRSSGRKSGAVRRENKRLAEQTAEQTANRIQTPESEGRESPESRTDSETPDWRQNPTKPPDSRACARGGGNGYAWRGVVVRLNRRDYDTWRTAYHAIDLDAHLRALDDYYADNLKPGENWFPRCSQALAKRHEDALKRRDEEAHAGNGRVWDGVL